MGFIKNQAMLGLDQVRIKVIGSQWYWDYELKTNISNPYESSLYPSWKPLFELKEFSSYMLPFDELYLGKLRLLQVDIWFFRDLKLWDF